MTDEPHWQTAKEYRSELAAELADLASIRHDLDFVNRSIELASLIPDSALTASENSLSDDLVRRNSLCNSAIVAYARCFGTGVRRVRLSGDLFAALGDRAAEATSAHNYFLELRNKYVAHSVNSFERVKVALLVGDGTHSQRGVVGGGPFLLRLAFEKTDNLRTLQNLATFLKRHVESSLNKMVEQVLDEAKTLDEATLEALPKLEFPIPVLPEEVSKRRPG